MIKNSIYIRVDRTNCVVYTYGIRFCDFIKGVENDRNYLILSGSPNRCKFNRHLNFEYVIKEQLDELIGQDVGQFGDFCWVDFKEEHQLDMVTKEELAALLYMNHMKSPWNDFVINSLKNEYAYLCHDDGTWNAVYMKDTLRYKEVIQYKLNDCLWKINKEGKVNIDLIEEINRLCEEGLVIDIDGMSKDKIDLYTIGNVFTIDDLENELLDNRRYQKDKKYVLSLSNNFWDINEV